MKRVLASVLALTLAFSISACDNKKTNTASDDNDTTQNVTETLPATKKIEGIFTDASEFSEGLAFVKLKDEDGLFCIDTEGNIVFTLSDEYYCAESFFNGWAMVHNAQWKYFLCDTSGNIIDPEDFGGTNFVHLSGGMSDWDIPFYDGYIIIEKNETAFNSNDSKDYSKSEFGLLNTDLEWLVPISRDFYLKYETYYDNHLDRYHNGYFINRDVGYLDLRTGNTGTDLSDIANVEGNVNTLYTCAPNGDCENMLTEELLFKLYHDKLNNNFWQTANQKFKNDYSVVVSIVNQKFAAVVIDSSGSFITTDPIVLDNKGILSKDFEKALMLVGPSMRENTPYEFTVRDFTGKILATKTFDEWVQCSLRDDVIMTSCILSNVGIVYNYYNTDFEPLF